MSVFTGSVHIVGCAGGVYCLLGRVFRPFFFCAVEVLIHWAACFLRRERQSAIMAINSLLVGLPLMLETV